MGPTWKEIIAETFPQGPSYTKELSIILPAVEEAATLCESIAKEQANSPTTKADDSPVTIADFGSQYILTEAIKSKFPHDIIIAEEDLDTMTMTQKDTLKRFLGRDLVDSPLLPSANESTRRFWTIDPIDGTKGYLRGGQYAICVALVEDTTVKMSILGCPRLPCRFTGNMGTVFIAINSAGAVEIDLTTRAYQSLSNNPHSSNSSTPILAESVESTHTDHHFSQQFASKLGLSKDTIRMDSQCKYGLVARGEAHIYLRRPTKVGYRERIWDHAPGVLLVSEAGGTVTDFTGSPLIFYLQAELIREGGILATNLPSRHSKGNLLVNNSPSGHSKVLSVLQSIQ